MLTYYRIIDRLTGKAQGVYSRSYGDEYDFHSPEAARTANCHGLHSDKSAYRIDEYKLVLVREGVDD